MGARPALEGWAGMGHSGQRRPGLGCVQISESRRSFLNCQGGAHEERMVGRGGVVGSGFRFRLWFELGVDDTGTGGKAGSTGKGGSTGSGGAIGSGGKIGSGGTTNTGGTSQHRGDDRLRRHCRHGRHGQRRRFHGRPGRRRCGLAAVWGSDRGDEHGRQRRSRRCGDRGQGRRDRGVRRLGRGRRGGRWRRHGRRGRSSRRESDRRERRWGRGRRGGRRCRRGAAGSGTAGAGGGVVVDPVVARGDYLVRNVLGCAGCHTPQGGAFLSGTDCFVKSGTMLPQRAEPHQ